MVVAESARNLYKSTTLIKNYCDLWKLDINIAKNKRTRKTRNIPTLQFGETQLDVADQYTISDSGIDGEVNSGQKKSNKVANV